MQKNSLIWSLVLVVCAGMAFYGGTQYGTSRALRPENLQNIMRSRGGPQGGAPMTGRPMGRNGDFMGRNGGAVFGEILSKDDTSMTVKLQDGGSKIIFYSTTTEVGKFVATTPQNLTIGENIVVNGTANPDGSVTAQSIQVRPVVVPVTTKAATETPATLPIN